MRFFIFLEFEYLYFVQIHNQAAQVSGLETMYWNVFEIQSIFVNKIKTNKIKTPSYALFVKHVYFYSFLMVKG